MKNLLKNLFVLTGALLISVTVVSAQHMQHSQKDTTKQMMHHKMMNDSTKMHHNMNDSTMMNHQMMNDTTQMNSSGEKNFHKQLKVKTHGIWNKYCPVKGGEVDPDAPTVKYKGKTIGFCCPGCDEKFKSDPEKYMRNLSKDGKKFIGEK